MPRINVISLPTNVYRNSNTVSTKHNLPVPQAGLSWKFRTRKKYGDARGITCADKRCLEVNYSLEPITMIVPKVEPNCEQNMWGNKRYRGRIWRKRRTQSANISRAETRKQRENCQIMFTCLRSWTLCSAAQSSALRRWTKKKRRHTRMLLKTPHCYFYGVIFTPKKGVKKGTEQLPFWSSFLLHFFYSPRGVVSTHTWESNLLFRKSRFFFTP